ncbi:MAG: ATP-binding cassette domain-containing protein [Cyanobacteriota bacterium]|nr:ATP-binding cassette domain-containing protein [Cyanobacteriota bacterium]
MIETVALSKKYSGTVAVNEVSFKVAEGETLGLIGTSGCGKTTTLKMLNRLIEPTSGRILVAGEEVRSVQPEKLRRRMGYVIQNTGLFPHFTIADNIAVVPRLLKWKEKRIAARTAELLELVGLPADRFRDRFPRELSGGQQQRVGLARALAADPPIILLDEPFGALDQITRRQIQQEFKRLESLLHKTMVLVTHDIFEAVELCDRLCLMDGGNIQQIGTPEELLFRPENDFVRNFFGGNRFQLELQVTQLGHLLQWLKLTEGENFDAKVYEEESSLLRVLEQLDDSSGIGIRHRHGKTFFVSKKTLLSAFYSYKEEKAEGMNTKPVPEKLITDY